MSRSKLLLLPVLACVLALVWVRPLDAWAARQVEAGLQRALTTFAAARALNAVLSAVQSVSVNVGVGVGASVHPGAVLEPIDDLVEQFSALMLVATVSFAVQRVLLDVLGAWPLAAGITLAALAWFGWAWQARPPPRWLPRLALGLLCLRLAVPLLALGSEGAFQWIMASDYQVAQAQISAAQLPDTAAPPAPDESLADRVKRWWSEGSDIARKVDLLKARADALVAHLVRLAAVFVVQTVVLPLLFLGMLWALYRMLAAGAVRVAGR